MSVPAGVGSGGADHGHGGERSKGNQAHQQQARLHEFLPRRYG
jgi:hypothetical protein